MSEQRVRLLLGGAPLVPLIDRIEQRIRRGRPLTGSITVPAADAVVRSAVAALLGRPFGGGATISVRLEDVDDVVRGSGAAPDLATAMVLLRGPIPITAEVAEEDEARWRQAAKPALEYARRDPSVAFLPELLERGGRLKRAAGGDPEVAARLAADIAKVLDELPSIGETLGAFSARVLHSAHRLDRGPLRGLLDTIVERMAEEQGLERDDGWRFVGIAPDASASSVLLHAFRFGEQKLGDVMAIGEPVPVTLGVLSTGLWPDVREVFVTENPAVLTAAAARFGTTCAPMLCVRGQPSAAAQLLLRLLQRSGAKIRYHGDFDWGGIRIANRIMRLYGAQPWRYGVEDLRAGPPSGAPLAGARVEADWEPALAAAIEVRGSRLEEEQVLDVLLPDLAR